jgi:hypothetical protein
MGTLRGEYSTGKVLDKARFGGIISGMATAFAQKGKLSWDAQLRQVFSILEIKNHGQIAKIVGG